MPGQITQVDVFGDSTDNFVQVRIPVDEPISGVIEFYQDNGPRGSPGKTARLEPDDTIDLSTATPVDSFVEDGFLYLSYETDYSIEGIIPRGFAVNYADEGVPESTIIFGNNAAARTKFTAPEGETGTLVGETIRSISDDAGTSKFDGVPDNGLVIDPETGTVSDESTDPSAVCFLKGTRIATPCGEVLVEDLRAGDTILTTDGREVTIKWIGRQSITAHGRFVERLYPVRIGEGALAPQMPSRDLFLSPDHALLLDGVLVNAAALVNGTTVTKCRRGDVGRAVEYFHIETADHSVIIANGVPAETFVDARTRRLFDNYGDYVARFGEDTGAAMPVLSTPRVFTARQLPEALRRRLAERMAKLLPMTRNAA